jgi:hypothetical protein
MYEFTITLARNGTIIYKRNNKVIPTKSILAYLSYNIEIKKGFTVRDLFKIINRYKFLQLLDDYYPAYIEEFRKCPQSNCKARGVKAITVQRVCSTDFGETYTYIYISALRNKPDENGETHSSVSFMGLNKMLDLPIQFEPILICSFSKEDKEDFRYIFPTYYNLWDLVNGFINELSFYGVPSERDKKKIELMTLVEEVESGRAKLIPHNQVLKEARGKGCNLQ